MRKIVGILFSILLIFIPLPFASAYISTDIYLNQDGSAIFVGQASQPISIEGIELQNGKLVGVTQELTTKTAGTWTFSLSLQDSAELKIFLPENAELKSIIKSNLDTAIGIEKDTIVVSLAGENPSLSFNYELDSNKKKDYTLLLILSLILIILIIVLLYLRKKKKSARKINTQVKKRTRRIDIVKKTLNEREQQIVNEIIKIKRAKQSFLQKKTGIPKASFSRHIQNLESKGIVIKTGIGKNNFIELKREML